jgi:hypothetical protein
MDFPMPDFGSMSAINQILDYSTDWLDTLGNFLWVVATFYLVLRVLLWLISVIRKPPVVFD